MSFDIEELYKLLPAVYRIRDMAQGRRVPAPAPGEDSLAVQDERGNYLSVPLKELLSVIADQIVILEENLAQLYDDQFVETCAPWVLPYIGDLIGLTGLPGDASQGLALTPRAEVANTIAYRRRKGTASMLEQLARDVTGWPARAVEFFQLLAWTQYMNHLRPLNLAFAHVRDADRLEWLNTPFEHTNDQPDPPLPTTPPRGTGYRLPGVKETLGSIFERSRGVEDIAHTVDVRRVASARGRYNIPNIGIFLWRLRAYSLKRTHAVQVSAGDATRYLFSPLGNNTQLFIRPVTETEITHLAEPLNAPLPISRRFLRRRLSELYGASLLVETEQPDGSGGTKLVKVSASQIEVCDLSDVKDGGGNVIGWAHTPTTKVSVDPVLGRLAFPSAQTTPVLVSFHYGFSDDTGGGEYTRAGARRGPEQVFTVASVPGEQGDFKTIADARTALNAATLGTDKGVIEIEDSGRYVENFLVINVTGKRVEIRAADKRRPVVTFRQLLNLHQRLNVRGGESDELTLDGLVITGGLRISDTLGRVRLRHCTLVPGGSLKTDGTPSQPASASLIVESPQAVVEIDRSIVGGIHSAPDARFIITDSIVDATSTKGVAFSGLAGTDPGGTLRVENSTIIGTVFATAFELASNTIFHAALPDNPPAGAKAVQVVKRQEGCVRFSCLPVSASVPRRYRCQPPTADANAPRPKLLFNSTRYGEPAYCQLSALCGDEIRRGADDESEMGAFHGLHQPQREAHLRARLEEYLRFGLEAGVFFAS